MSVIAAGATTGTALIVTGDTTGGLVLQVNGSTPAITLNTSQAVGVGSSPSYGTSGQVLTSSGSAAAPTWTTPATGALTLISTTTASSSANVLFTGLSSTYTNYMVVVSAAVPANNVSEFRCQLSINGGTSYVSLEWYLASWYPGVATVTGSSGGNDYIRLAQSVSNSATNGGISGVIMLFNPANTAGGKNVRAEMAGYNTGGTPRFAGNSIASGNYQNFGSAVNAVNFLFDTGNITSGTFKLYGIS